VVEVLLLASAVVELVTAEVSCVVKVAGGGVEVVELPEPSADMGVVVEVLLLGSAVVELVTAEVSCVVKVVGGGVEVVELP
jgi:hypothetical protein